MIALESCEVLHCIKSDKYVVLMQFTRNSGNDFYNIKSPEITT